MVIILAIDKVFHTYKWKFNFFHRCKHVAAIVTAQLPHIRLAVRLKMAVIAQIIDCATMRLRAEGHGLDPELWGRVV